MTDRRDEENLYFNGINGDTGGYDIPPMSSEQLMEVIQGESPAENLNELRFRYQQSTTTHLGVKEGVDPTKLEEAGWGIIFAHDADPAIKEALSELLELRRGQTEHFFVFEGGSNGYRVGSDTKGTWLARQGAGPGPADPEKVPYYLLIAGSPQEIPYRFQTQLDVQYAVGRIHFDTLQEYANYAASVVTSETTPLKLRREVAFFNVANDDDRSTQRSAELLVDPLSADVAGAVDGWTFNNIAPADAKKARLARLLGGDETPALLFTSSHGMKFDLGSDRQLPHQGALLCGDWPGPEAWAGPIPHDHYFAGEDLSHNGNLLGQIAFFFACYGAGTPLHDEFSKLAFKQRTEIAPHPFMAQLPSNMIAHPRGGALAVIGHVERAWSNSYTWPGAGVQTEVFKSTLLRLLKGHPVGSAIEYFNERYAELATVLSDELEEIDYGKRADPYALSRLWTANNDARGYAIIGDPAVRLPVAAPGEASHERPLISVHAPVDTASPAAAPEEVPSIVPKSILELEESEPVSHAISAEGQPSVIVSKSVTLPQESSADLMTITVKTFASDDITDPNDRKLLIETRLTLDGSSEIVISTVSGEVDAELMALHQAMAKEALAARLAYLKLMA